MKPNIAEKIADIIQEVRKEAAKSNDGGFVAFHRNKALDLCGEVERQAEEIESRDAEIERLREALKNARGALRFIPSDTVGYDGVLSMINGALRRDTQSEG
jgi:hypothetical protein